MKALESIANQSTKSQAADLSGTKSATESIPPTADLPETKLAASQSIESAVTDLPPIDTTSTPPSHPFVIDKRED